MQTNNLQLLFAPETHRPNGKKGKVRTVKVIEKGKVVDKVVKCPKCGRNIGDIIFGEIHVYFKCFICWELFDLGLRA